MTDDRPEKDSKEVPDHFFRQSAVVPCRMQNGKLEVLLVTTIRKGKWGVPKGVVEPELTPEVSALREAFEEAGVEGDIIPTYVGSYAQKKWGGICNVAVYPMIVDKIHRKWPESSVRKRKWVPGSQAHRLVNRRRLAPLVRAAVAIAKKHLVDLGYGWHPDTS